jgi:alpha-D-xyloside xylohydrolase
MKFTKGFWWLREGIVAHHPAEAYETECTKDELKVFAPVQPIKDRGATLNCPMISVSLSSPREGIIRVRLSHFKGAVNQGPAYELQEEDTSVLISSSEEAATFTTGNLTAKVSLKKESWGIEFREGNTFLTNTGFRNIGYIEDTLENKVYMKEELSLGVAESIYGLGERFTPFIKNGQVIDMWNDDGGTASEISYKNIPFYLSSRGYGVYVNHPEKISFEVGSEKVERVGFSIPGEVLEYYIISGPSPREILDRYTALTGRPGLPPQWSFGLWLTTSFTTDYDEETVTSFVTGMEERDLPLHVFHFDCFWMKGFHWIDLEWDPKVFPDPKGMLERLKARGLKICVWINPYIAQRSSMFEEAMNNGYLLMKDDGSVYQRDLWQAGMGLIDFTNPEATSWYKERLGALVDMGVDSFKTDFGEQIPTDVVYHDGSDPIRMHNYYTYLYNESVFEVLEEKLGYGEAVLFARSAAVGGQKFPVHWGGDCTATYESMAESLRGGLSLGLSGFGFWSHDMGGFESTASPDVYKRWVAFGCLSSHSRLHGSSSYRVPWLYDEESVDVLRHFTKLKCKLMPYLFQKASEAHHQGSPVMRALCYEFPNDPGSALIDRQYMLGESLMVAPVFDPNGDVEYFLPEGTWTDFSTGEKKEGGRWLKENYDYLGLPLLARENSVIPVGAINSKPDYPLAEDVLFHVFQFKDGSSTTIKVPDDKGQPSTVLTFSKEGNTLSITPEKASGNWKVCLRNVDKLNELQGGKETKGDLGIEITPSTLQQSLTISYT